MEVQVRPVAPRTVNRPIPLRLAGACLLAAVMVLVAPFVPHRAAFGLAAAIPLTFVTYLLARRQQWVKDYLEVIVPFSAFYFMYFGVCGVYCVLYPETLPSLTLLRYLIPAMALSVVGYLCFVAGYATLFTRTAPSRTLDLRPNGLSGVLIFGVLGWIGQIAMTYQGRFMYAHTGAPSAALSTVQVLAPLFYYGWFQAWYLFWSGWNTPLRRALLVLLFIPMTGSVFVGHVGSKMVAILLTAMPALAFWYARRAFPWKTIAAITLAGVFVVFPIYNNYRNQSPRLDTLERLERTLREARRWDSETYLQNSTSAFMRRMAVITSVAAILRDVPRSVDFKYGETLVLAPISILIPRFVWPDKPNIAIGGEFGRTFHLASWLGEGTYIAATIVGELYWNFHVPGVVIGMFLFGGALRWYYQRYGTGPWNDPVRKSIYVALLVSIMHFEGNLAVLIGNWVKTLSILLLLLFVLRRMRVIVPDPQVAA